LGGQAQWLGFCPLFERYKYEPAATNTRTAATEAIRFQVKIRFPIADELFASLFNIQCNSDGPPRRKYIFSFSIKFPMFRIFLQPAIRFVLPLLSLSGVFLPDYLEINMLINLAHYSFMSKHLASIQ
jgi:hypothetical protein